MDTYNKVICFLFINLCFISVKGQVNVDSLTNEANNGNVDAMYVLGNFYYSGNSEINPDHEKSYHYFTEVIEKSSSRTQIGQAYSILGAIFNYGGKFSVDYKKAIEYYNKGMEYGDGLSFHNLSLLYQAGDGVAKDLKQAFNILQKGTSAEHNAHICQNRLALFYDEGIGTKKDSKKAFYWYDKAARNGNKNAMNSLGNAYWKGRGVEEDQAIGFYWHHRSAILGDINGMTNLGHDLGWGIGAFVDYQAATAWLRYAAKKGSKMANDHLKYIPSVTFPSNFQLFDISQYLNKSSDEIFQIAVKMPEDDPNAIKLLYEHILINDSNITNTMKAYIYNNIGVLYENKGNLESAKSYYNAAMNFDKLNDVIASNYQRAKKTIKSEKRQQFLNFLSEAGEALSSMSNNSGIGSNHSSNNTFETDNNSSAESSKTSKQKCKECLGNGKCSGSGASSKYHCHGSGKCYACNGKSAKQVAGQWTDCDVCNKTGKCKYCNGTGKCSRCGGKGYL